MLPEKHTVNIQEHGDVSQVPTFVVHCEEFRHLNIKRKDALVFGDRENNIPTHLIV